MDETLALPSDHAVKIALRTQQIIAYEIGVANTIDPLAGSYFVEALTNKIEDQAEKYFEEIERRGGVLKCIEQGYFQKEIARSAYRYQKEIEAKDRIVVGINDFIEPDEEIKIPILYIDPQVEKDQCAALKKIKQSRDNDKVKRSLENLRKVAQGSDNTVPGILECVRCYTTEGEIVDLLREVFGEYQEPPFF